MWREFFTITAICFLSEALPLEKRFLMLFGHQYNNPGDMTNEFSGNTGGSSNVGNTGNSGTSGSQNINSIPGDATHYLDNTHSYYHAMSGGNAGYVQHAGNSGPAFASQSSSTGHGTDHLPGKCPWIGCSFDCQDIDSVTGCIICINGCSSSSSGVNANGGSGSSSNTGNSVSTGPGQLAGGSNSVNGNQTGNGTGQIVGTTTGGNNPNNGSVHQNGGGAGTNTGSAPSTCPPFPVNCPRGSAMMVNGCPECNVMTTTVAMVHRATCQPTRCVAPCNKGVSIDVTTGCPVCIC
ncbi:N66 matrix protein-like [Ylistrum balloti]|uniref:N66 matrix protein-like n=1 Tax=Ylistrum balloti TaxID=509963 RepID=UPI002905A94E|nr:N66 matrix protein-like [Ylistrum balloti]